MPRPLPCPSCKKTVDPANEDFPFCSERCKLIDLGKWASGEYTIASPIHDPELLEEVEQARQTANILSREERPLVSRWKN